MFGILNNPLLGQRSGGGTVLTAVSTIVTKNISFSVISKTDKKPLMATVKLIKGFGLLNSFGIRPFSVFDAWTEDDKGNLVPTVVQVPVGYYNYEIIVDGYSGKLQDRILIRGDMNIPILV
jgi:hypothetical protein